jgi:hypothetical protein
MAKQVQIWLLVLCLGLFIVPKQYFLPTAGLNSCCSVSVSKKDKCKTEHEKDDCHKDHNNKNHCTGNCNNCDICHFAMTVFHLPKLNDTPSESFDLQVKKERFSYITPEISDIFSKIWQPPKIG